MLLLLPVCSTVRNFDRSSVRSRSFKRLNRAFSVLRRTKSGTAVSNETSEERDNARNSSVPQEGTDHSLSAVLAACVLKLLRIPRRGSQSASNAYLRVYFQGDTTGSPECNSSICCFNNSAARCISLLVHHQRSTRRVTGGPRHFRQGEVTGDEAADTVHHVLPSSSIFDASFCYPWVARFYPNLIVSSGDRDCPRIAGPQHSSAVQEKYVPQKSIM